MLVNVFESFCNTCLKNYLLNLAPAHFYASPGLDSEYLEHEVKPKVCELYPGRFKLELTRDIDMLLLFGKDIPDGITRMMKRYPNTNNKYKVNLYNHADLIRCLAFPDADNLYVFAMIQKLPTRGFESK